MLQQQSFYNQVNVQTVCLVEQLPEPDFIRDCTASEYQTLFKSYSQRQIDSFRQVRRIRMLQYFSYGHTHMHAVISRKVALQITHHHVQRVDVQAICNTFLLPHHIFVRDCTVVEFHALFKNYDKHQIHSFRRVRRIRTLHHVSFRCSPLHTFMQSSVVNFFD